ncbi:hypothetical protein M422DRAFT_48255 [Sphaerobolus stellatus SS14]|uniref:Uncharacterized protein n=1 Tax=Sphaerobolus stellatus (strain SS14) TaxID=990650 RepID=A0A0C9VL63_SPHS4|nr:hypothetical protein M422DRAFT_48255 [Sphaerobolus stellatus SS14]
MANIRSYFTLQLLNVLTYLWFTAANVFAFSLSFGLRNPIDIDPPDQYKYGYGLGKETYLTPSPWIYGVLFLIHILFAGTVAFAQWTDRGKDIVVGSLNFRWPLLMVLSTVWTGTWLRQWYVWSWLFSIAVTGLAIHTNRVVKRNYRLENELDVKDEIFIHVPFSLFEGWAILTLAVNTFAAFAPISLGAGLASKIFAVWILAAISGMAHLSAFSTRAGDIPSTLILTLGQFAIFAHQISRSSANSRHVIAWFAFSFGIVSVWALAKSVWGTVDVVRNGSGAVRLEEDEERQ